MTGQLAGYKGVPLLADLDGDSLQAELKGCDTYNDVNVIAVVNGVPRYYEDGEPMQENGGGYATGNTNQTGEENGIKGFYGGSVGIGYSKGKEGVLKASVKVEGEYLRRTGTSTEVVESTTSNKGEGFESESRGIVVYDSSSYKCCQYDAYYPSTPADRATMLTCTPAHMQPQTSRTLEDWNLPKFKTEAGPSWVDVGRAAAPEVHRQNNDVFTYPDNLPVDPYLVKWHDPGANTTVQWNTNPEGNPHTWGLEQSHEEKKVHKGGTETKITVSGALEVGHVEFETSAFGGVEK